VKAQRIQPTTGWQSMGLIASLLYDRPIKWLAPYHRGRSHDPEASWISEQLFGTKTATGSISLKPGRDQRRRSRFP
jgi:hypothetical protein